jgi:hypothetical protein
MEGPNTVTGAQLSILLPNRQLLHGLACPIHGLQYAAIALPGECVTVDRLQRIHAQGPMPQAGQRICCTTCGQNLAAPIGGLCSSITAPVAALVELTQLAGSKGAPKRPHKA